MGILMIIGGVGIVLLIVMGSIEGVINKKHQKLTVKERMKLIQQGKIK